MQLLQRGQRWPADVVVGHDDEVDVAAVRLELAERDGAVEIDADERWPEDRADVADEPLEERVDVRVLRGTAQRASDSKTGRMRSSAVRRFASEFAYEKRR